MDSRRQSGRGLCCAKPRQRPASKRRDLAARRRLAYRTMAGRMRRRRQSRVALGQGRHRQVAHLDQLARTARRRAASRDPLPMFPPPHERCVSSDRPSNFARGNVFDRRGPKAPIEKLESMARRSRLEPRTLFHSWHRFVRFFSKGTIRRLRCRLLNRKSV